MDTTKKHKELRAALEEVKNFPASMYFFIEMRDELNMSGDEMTSFVENIHKFLNKTNTVMEKILNI